MFLYTLKYYYVNTYIFFIKLKVIQFIHYNNKNFFFYYKIIQIIQVGSDNVNTLIKKKTFLT
jgi:hypothetical protein